MKPPARVRFINDSDTWWIVSQLQEVCFDSKRIMSFGSLCAALEVHIAMICVGGTVMCTIAGIDFDPFPSRYLTQYLILWYNYHKKLKIVEPMFF